MSVQWLGRALAVFVALVVSAGCATTYAQGRNYPNYPRSGGIYRGGGYADTAYQRGFDDGYRQGLDAASDRDRYDPRRESWYRSGDRGYDRRYGSRNDYRQAYRDAFVRGYDRGYREGRLRDNDRARRRW